MLRSHQTYQTLSYGVGKNLKQCLLYVEKTSVEDVCSQPLHHQLRTKLNVLQNKFSILS